ncbi:SRPBCC family protein [Mesorhizobium sp. M0701]|uniref:SRPBCC family protein n=1 Tax=Mesorhizobium sp. M0701 TaxID=2956989 RepID=UPI00333CCF47
MAQAYASAVIDAPIDAVWEIIRDFNGLPNWHPMVARSEIEDGRQADAVGAIRSFYFVEDGRHVRERLIALNDQERMFAYAFILPAFPVENYVGTMHLLPVTNGDHTFAEWSATFDEAPNDKGKYVDIISNGAFATGLKALQDKLRDR